MDFHHHMENSPTVDIFVGEQSRIPGGCNLFQCWLSFSLQKTIMKKKINVCLFLSLSQIIQEFNQQLFMQENPVFHKAHDFQFQPSECDMVRRCMHVNCVGIVCIVCIWTCSYSRMWRLNSNLLNQFAESLKQNSWTLIIMFFFTKCH